MAENTGIGPTDMRTKLLRAFCCPDEACDKPGYCLAKMGHHTAGLDAVLAILSEPDEAMVRAMIEEGRRNMNGPADMSPENFKSHEERTALKFKAAIASIGDER